MDTAIATAPGVSAAEAQRLAALQALDILNTQPEAIFDSLTNLAAQTFRTPVAVVSLIDANRQWFKSCLGLDATETERDVAFCDHTIRQARTMIIPDALDDPRFRDNPLVTGDPNIRFYAGAPLSTPEGHKLGSLCVIDFQPRRDFGPNEAAQLEAMAEAVSAAMQLRRDVRAFVAVERDLHETQARVQRHEQELAFLTANSADLILRIDPASVITWASPSSRHYGYEPDEVVGVFAGDLIHPEDRPKFAARRPERFAAIGDLGGERREYRIRTKAGGWIWVEENPRVIRDAAGAPVELINVLRDVSDRKQAERAATEIQAGMLLPRSALAKLSPHVEVDAVLAPARNVGGDLYDAFLIGPNRLCFLLGDVTGKGVAASLFMALAKALSHSLLTRMADDLPAAFAAIEAELERNNGQAMALALLAGVLDLASGELTLCNAGHENPVLIRRDGQVSDVRLDGGPPLCAGAGFAYRAERTVLGRGETLVAVTDGVTEATNATAALFGRTALHAALATAAASPLTTVTDQLVTSVRRFEDGEEPTDDLAILAIRRPG
ncbi:MAG: SpoIIE family protein phosphatase [Pseudomonadota bacterium]